MRLAGNCLECAACLCWRAFAGWAGAVCCCWLTAGRLDEEKQRKANTQLQRSRLLVAEPSKKRGAHSAAAAAYRPANGQQASQFAPRRAPAPPPPRPLHQLLPLRGSSLPFSGPLSLSPLLAPRWRGVGGSRAPRGGCCAADHRRWWAFDGCPAVVPLCDYTTRARRPGPPAALPALMRRRSLLLLVHQPQINERLPHFHEALSGIAELDSELLHRRRVVIARRLPDRVEDAPHLRVRSQRG